jgi:polyisoprenoid-binding protein YceI
VLTPAAPDPTVPAFVTSGRAARSSGVPYRIVRQRAAERRLATRRQTPKESAMSVTAANASAVIDRASRELATATADPRSSTPVLPEGVWLIDPAASTVAFSVANFWVSTVRGEMHDVEGTLEVDGDGRISVRASVGVASIDTGNRLRDRHLRSTDFLAADRHPRADLRSRSVRRLADGRLVIDAELRLRGVVAPVAIAARVLAPGAPHGDEPVSVIGGGALDRRAFGVARRPILDHIVGVRVGLAFDLCLAEAGDPTPRHERRAAP